MTHLINMSDDANVQRTSFELLQRMRRLFCERETYCNTTVCYIDSIVSNYTWEREKEQVNETERKENEKISRNTDRQN
jgi:hypothetical protein